ncbi:MAG TPA: tetratricopeptide repeat protein [Flavisolibacter sp.]|nr:tetratricopeptide repeat protein [Flavisolibacter sp.]
MIKVMLTSAVLCISTLLLAQNDSSAYFLQKGLEEKGKGRRMESLKQFEKAYGYNKASKEVVSELAAAYYDLRRYAQAREKYLQLESLGDKTDNTYKQLMLLSFNMRQFDDAIKYANLLKKNNPSEKTAFYIGKAYYEKEDLGNAIKFLDMASKEDEQNADVPYMVARAYADMQNYRSAIPYFQKAVKLNPSQSYWIYEMALIYYAANDDQNSLKYMLEAAEKGLKKDNAYLQNLATAYLNVGRFNEGVNVLLDLLKLRPSDKNLMYTVAEAYYNAKKYDDAIGYYDEVLRLDKQSADALYMIGMCYQKKGEKQKGMQLCDKAIEMDPSLQSLKQKKEMPGGF